MAAENEKISGLPSLDTLETHTAEIPLVTNGATQKTTSGSIRRYVKPKLVLDVDDYGAIGEMDPMRPDDAAFAAAIADLAEGGTLYATRKYYLADHLMPDKTIEIRGAARDVSAIKMAARKSIKIRHEAETGDGDAVGSKILNQLLLGTYVAIDDWQHDHAYVVGDRVRSEPQTIDSGVAFEEDAGIHFVCTQAGTSGSSQPNWNTDPASTTSDGECVWAPENWSLLQITTTFVTIEQCRLVSSSDSLITVLGFASIGTVADDAHINRCRLGIGDGVAGHGIFFNGDDGNTSFTLHNHIEGLSRGAGIYDSSFLSNRHDLNSVVLCRRSYVGEGTGARTVWTANYAEAVDGHARILKPNMWLSGEPGLFSLQTNAVRFDGQRWFGGLVTGGTTDPPLLRSQGSNDGFERILVDGDQQGMIDDLASRADDPAGVLAMQFEGVAAQCSRELTMERSRWGANKLRFPLGFFRGRNDDVLGTKQMRELQPLDHPPDSGDLERLGTLLFEVGDTVPNALIATDQASGWRAKRRGGWGGGRHYVGHRWTASAGLLGRGDGIQPSIANENGFVYVLIEIERSGDGGTTWARDNTALYATLSNTEPTWNATMGAETVEVLTPNVLRVRWLNWGESGMTWATLPAPDGEIDT